MRRRMISPFDFTVQELDRELIARAAEKPKEELFDFPPGDAEERDIIMKRIKKLYASPPPRNPALKDIDDIRLSRALMFKIGKLEIDGVRGAWEQDERLDIFMIEDEKVLNNAYSVATICLKDRLEECGNNCFKLIVNRYKETYKLCENENFCYQPNIEGLACTGFLVDEDIIATAYHCVNKKPLRDLRFVFGYRMLDPSSPVVEFQSKDIYEAREILDKRYIRRGNFSDWAFIKLDRKVEGKHIVELSKKDVYSEQGVYTIGHPCGLPLKYAPGASVRGVKKENFIATMDIYSGNSGSPVFDSNTHQLVGIVIHGHNRDFRWTGKCWTTVIYPDDEFGSECSRSTHISEFRNSFARHRSTPADAE
jgi:hypothetical protein